MGSKETRRYKSKPFDCWKLAKEIKAKHYREVAESRTMRGKKLLIGGGTQSVYTLAAGLGEYVFLGGEPYAASLTAGDPRAAMKCMDAAEAAGFARDLCAYMIGYIGSLLTDRYYFGGSFPRADFYMQTHFCDTHAKWYQIVSEMVDVPYYCMDLVPLTWDETEEGRRQKIDYLIGEFLDGIDWMQRVSGREYEDELLIDAVKNEFTSTSLWAECALLNQAVPAPMDINSMCALYLPQVLVRHKPETVRFYELLRDEIRDRVAGHIAAVPTERFRILHDAQPPWYALRIFRYLERFGVVCVGTNHEFGLSGGWDYKAGEYLRPAVPLQKRHVPLKTREDACRALAQWWLDHHLVCRGTRFSGAGRNGLILQMLKDWQCDGLLMGLNYGCEGQIVGQMEIRQAAANAGIPVTTYEINVGDPQGFDEPGVMARIDTFLESLGLEESRT